MPKYSLKIFFFYIGGQHTRPADLGLPKPPHLCFWWWCWVMESDHKSEGLIKFKLGCCYIKKWLLCQLALRDRKKERESLTIFRGKIKIYQEKKNSIFFKLSKTDQTPQVDSCFTLLKRARPWRMSDLFVFRTVYYWTSKQCSVPEHANVSILLWWSFD